MKYSAVYDCIVYRRDLDNNPRIGTTIEHIPPYMVHVHGSAYMVHVHGSACSPYMHYQLTSSCNSLSMLNMWATGTRQEAGVCVCACVCK